MKRCWTPRRVAAACPGAKGTRDRQGLALAGGNPSSSAKTRASLELTAALPQVENLLLSSLAARREREVAKVLGRVLNKDLLCVKGGFPPLLRLGAGFL